MENLGMLNMDVDGELLVLLVRIAVDVAAWHFLAPTMRDVRGCEKRVHWDGTPQWVETRVVTAPPSLYNMRWHPSATYKTFKRGDDLMNNDTSAHDNGYLSSSSLSILSCITIHNHHSTANAFITYEKFMSFLWFIDIAHGLALRSDPAFNAVNFHCWC